MKIIVDSNIVFSAILNTQSNIGQILTIGSKYFDFYSINLLIKEIKNHKSKIQKITGYNNKVFDYSLEMITSKIRFVDDFLISDEHIIKAINLTKDVDPDDALFVALANYLKSKLWTGDKKLEYSLKEKGFNQIINTAQMYQIFMKKQLKSYK